MQATQKFIIIVFCINICCKYYLYAQTNIGFNYDASNRVERIEYPNGSTITYTYDAVGNRLTQTISTSPLAPQANFSANPTSGPVPLQATFTDASVPGSNPITSWQWDFNNDGNYDANGQGPHIYTYTSVGIYSVKLRVSDGTLYSEHIQQNYITVTTATNQPPIVQNTIPNQNLFVGGSSFTRDLEVPPVVFFDPDGDILNYTVSSSNELIATATITQSLSKIILVPPTNEIIESDVSNSSNKVDKLIYNNAEIDGGLNGSLLTVSPLSEGTTIITVTADDGQGGIISTEFNVLVNPPWVQFTEQSYINLIGVSESSIALGDFDNDNDLDLLITGRVNTTSYASKIYKNNGDNTFTEQTSISLTGVYDGSVAWGDYDNDSDLDILLTGFSSAGRISKIYKNNGDNTFSIQNTISLVGVNYNSVAWGDYDNDGDLDILLTGQSSSGEVSKIYKNNSDNTFTEQTTISLTGVVQGSVAWGDYDNDGDLDILLTGTIIGTMHVSKVYRNDGDDSFSEETSITLPGVWQGSVAWGDYDSDGDLDILLTGYANEPISKIYRNNGNSTFEEQTSISLSAVYASSANWGDYDNDGYLDLLLTGWGTTGPSAKIFRNNGDQTFTEQLSISLLGVYYSSTSWGDYDNDGDLDIMLSGYSSPNGSRVSKIYRNNNITSNSSPNVPTNLVTTITGSDVNFSWDKSNDNETPQNGLKYNLVIGTSPNAVNTLSPMSDRTSGYRRVINLGNTNHNNSWTIKGLEPGTYYWSVQAVDNCFSGSAFCSENSFAINTSSNWTHQIALRDAGGTETIISFGQKPNATNGIDTVYGEGELPPLPPPSGQYDARFILPIIPETSSYIDIRDSSDTVITWKMFFQPGTAGYPMTINWDTLSFPSGTFYLTDTINGSFVNVNMRNQSSYTITNASIKSLNIKYQRQTSFPLSVSVSNGWNMVSIPGLHPTDQNVTTWWPYLTGTVWGYNGVQYFATATATPGEGYWMRNVGAIVYNYPAIQIVPHTPINAVSGWNIIGGYEDIVATANLTTNPPGQLTGTIWGYNGVQYVAATNFVPGYSYWMRLLPGCPCTITLPEALAKGNEVVEIFKEDWGRIVITDAAGISTTLYAVKGEVDLDQYEMPPMPPSGSFDIRYSSGRIAEDLNSAIKTIDMSGVTYPLTVRVEGMDIRLQDETGKALNQNLKSGEDVVISDATIQKLMVSGEMIPAEYALEQNYPNPFNPITTIKFSLPEATDVALTIYNVLGEKVTELVNSKLEAGRYSYHWNAVDVATGMYIYELRTDKFVSVKKMILLK